MGFVRTTLSIKNIQNQFNQLLMWAKQYTFIKNYNIKFPVRNTRKSLLLHNTDPCLYTNFNVPVLYKLFWGARAF